MKLCGQLDKEYQASSGFSWKSTSVDRDKMKGPCLPGSYVEHIMK